MKKSKSRRPRDRLSELPESLIFHIFWLLPMRDVVRTTVLSKHWKNLWTTTPCLNFDFDHIFDDMDRSRNFVNRALMLWEGIKIQKFKIDFHTCSADDSFCSDFDFWLCFALRKKVQELYVYNPFDTDTERSLPQNLYSCSSLRVLSLVEFRLEMNGNEMNGNVQWNQLQSLTFDGLNMTEDAINKVLCGSPQLEVFILTLSEGSENLSIRSSSLKRLSIHYVEMNYGQWLGRELRIRTPNLETLEISGDPYTRCLLKDLSSLTHVNLRFYRVHYFNEIDLLGETLKTLKQVIPTIRHVEKVTLSDCCIEVLGDLIKEGLIPSSSNAKFLNLNNVWVEYRQIVEVLDIFPKLKMLVLDMKRHYQHVQEFDANLPKSFLLHLRTIDITTSEDDNSVFPFMQIVLENASKLEMMVIRVTMYSPRSNYLFSTSQKLLRMQRSFPAAEIIFCEVDLYK